MIREFFNRWQFWNKADRLGPDIPLTHWKLHFPKMALKLCKKKFYRFADSASVRPGSYVVGCSRISIGEKVVIRPASHIHGASDTLEVSIVIEDEVLIGSGVHIYVNNHRFSDPNVPIYYQGHSPAQPVILRKGCWLGANVVVLPGVEIGENSVVAAGSIVTKSVPPRVVVGGNPARIIKEILVAENQ